MQLQDLKLLFGDTAVCVNPKDKRYKSLIGKQAIVPICDRRVPVIADPYVDVEFGTGCLKVTPAHDINDYNLGIKHNLDTIDIFNKCRTKLYMVCIMKVKIGL